jgi:hypothetical protein
MCLALKVIELQPRGEISAVTVSDPHAEINKALSHSPVLIDTADTRHAGIQHQVRVLPTTSPHTTGFHEVWWLNEATEESDVYWDTSSEQRVLTNSKLLAELEQKIRLIQTVAQTGQSQDLRAYMYWGFTLPEWQNGTNASVIWRGLQSQQRLHWHLSQGIDANQTPDDWLQASQENIGHFARFLNLAGEFMIQSYRSMYSNFGETFSYQQPLQGNWPQGVKDRTLFAFSSLEEATQASLKLKNEVSHHWLGMAHSLHEHSPCMYAGTLFTMFQSAVPNFVFIIPSEGDKKIANRVDNHNEVWVAPFTVVGAPEMLTDGGIHLRRSQVSPAAQSTQ